MDDPEFIALVLSGDVVQVGELIQQGYKLSHKALYDAAGHTDTSTEMMLYLLQMADELVPPNIKYSITGSSDRSRFFKGLDVGRAYAVWDHRRTTLRGVFDWFCFGLHVYKSTHKLEFGKIAFHSLPVWWCTLLCTPNVGLDLVQYVFENNESDGLVIVKSSAQKLIDQVEKDQNQPVLDFLLSRNML